MGFDVVLVTSEREVVESPGSPPGLDWLDLLRLVPWSWAKEIWRTSVRESWGLSDGWVDTLSRMLVWETVESVGTWSTAKVDEVGSVEAIAETVEAKGDANPPDQWTRIGSGWLLRFLFLFLFLSLWWLCCTERKERNLLQILEVVDSRGVWSHLHDS